MVEIIWLAHAAVHAVSRPAFQQSFRQTLLDGEGMKVNQVLHQFPLAPQRIVPGTNLHYFAVSQHDFQLIDMIGGSAINRRVRAARVVGDHSPKGRTRTRGDVGSKAVTVWP